MSKYLSVGIVGVIVLSYGVGAAAQSTAPCDCGTISSPPMVSSGQSYQRFSYAPAPSQPAMAMGTVVAPSQSMNYSAPSTVVSSQPMTTVQPMVQNQASSAQGYRRFSYQPSSSGVSTSYRRPWEYPKADSHRYRP